MPTDHNGKKLKLANNKKKNTVDNRKDHRVPIQLLVDYRAEGHYLFDFCKDLGAGGVFIETNSPLAMDSEVDLTFTIPDSKKTIQAKGKVIWVQNPIDGRNDLTPGMGVQFNSFTKEQRAMLEDFVQRYSATNKVQTNENVVEKTA